MFRVVFRNEDGGDVRSSVRSSVGRFSVLSSEVSDHVRRWIDGARSSLYRRRSQRSNTSPWKERVEIYKVHGLLVPSELKLSQNFTVFFFLCALRA